MTPAKKTPTTNNDAKQRFDFILFVAGNEPNSMLARQNLKSLCAEHLPGRHTIEIIDVFQNLDATIKNNILITPTLLKVAPAPTITVFGNLSDSKKLIASLRI